MTTENQSLDENAVNEPVANEPAVVESTVNEAVEQVDHIDPAQLTEEQIDASMVQEQEHLAEIHGEVANVEEARSIGDAIAKSADVVQAAVDAEEGMTPSEAQLLDAAMEHFYTRLGVTVSRRMPAMESFKEDRLESSKLALEHLRDLQERIGKNLKVAQEGIFDRIGNAIARAFTSNKKMAKVVGGLSADQLGEVRSLGQPAWGRCFARTGHGQVSGVQVASLIGQVNSTLNGDMADVINKAAQGFSHLADEFARAERSGRFSEAAEKMYLIGHEVAEQCKRFSELSPDVVRHPDAYVEVLSCDHGSFRHIVEGVQNAAKESLVEKADQRLETAYNELLRAVAYDDEDEGGHSSHGGHYHAAISQADRILNILGSTTMDLYILQGLVIHGGYKYLLASTRQD